MCQDELLCIRTPCLFLRTVENLAHGGLNPHAIVSCLPAFGVEGLCNVGDRHAGFAEFMYPAQARRLRRNTLRTPSGLRTLPLLQLWSEYRQGFLHSLKHFGFVILDFCHWPHHERTHRHRNRREPCDCLFGVLHKLFLPPRIASWSVRYGRISGKFPLFFQRPQNSVDIRRFQPYGTGWRSICDILHGH
jgi:hypothetical protein